MLEALGGCGAVVPEERPALCERFPEQRLGLVVAALADQHIAEVIHRFRDIRMARAIQRAPLLERLPQQRLGLVEQAEARVHRTQHAPQLGLHIGLVRE